MVSLVQERSCKETLRVKLKMVINQSLVLFEEPGNTVKYFSRMKYQPGKGNTKCRSWLEIWSRYH